MKIKSFLSLLMVFVLMLGCMSGCGKNSTSGGSADKDGPNEDAEIFTIAKTAYYEEDDPWNGDGEYGEAIREAFAEIESEYNIKIEIDYYSPSDFRNIAQTAITNGDTEFADIMVYNLFAFGPLYSQGLLYDMSGIDGLDTNSDFWEDSIMDVSSFNNGVYGIGSSGLNCYSGGNQIQYNRDMIKSLGLEDPAELVRRGEWTWDKLREYSLKAVKDVNNDGKFTEDDRFGCTSQSYDGFCPVWLTAGVPTIKKDNAGSLVYNMLSNEAVNALQKFNSVFTVADGMFYAGGMDGLKQQDQFLSGKALFLIGGWTKEGEDTGEFEIATIPYPKYTAGGEYVNPVYHNTTIVSVPAITEKADLIGKVLQILGEKTKDFGKLYAEDTSIKYTDREQYVEMYEKYGGKISVDPFNIMLNVNETISIGTMRAIGMPIFTGNSYSGYTEGNAQKIQTLLDEMFNQK